MTAKKNNGGLKILFYVLGAIAISGLMLRVFVFEIYRVEKNSMNNFLFDGDRVIVNKLARHSLSRNDVIVFWQHNDVCIKRCIGMPGETVEMKQGRVFINNVEIASPSKAVLPESHLSMNEKQVSNIVMLDLFGKNWDMSNFGPYLVPCKGMTILLTPENLKLYRNMLESDEERDAPGNQSVTSLLNRSYTFKHNYYFVLGDNRPASGDSRKFGAISETQVIGKAGFIF